jgi:signal transduction histidine kinase/DNA-binding response OmpR family regulator/HAMP domain-containing protein
MRSASVVPRAGRSASRKRDIPPSSAPPPEGSGRLDEGLLLEALLAFRRGDFSARLPSNWTGVEGKIADAFNDVIELQERKARELARVARVVAKQGRIAERASIGDVRGSWAASVDSVNQIIGDLVFPIVETARVIGAVAKGDLSQHMSVERDGRPLEGEVLRTARTVNTMVDQLGSFASEVSRVACEVGTEGKLGGQARVKGVAGIWKDLTENVNLMAGNLTGQVRNIAAVTTAVANGDLAKKITADVRGEFLELKATINTMVDQLRSFASEVTRVAREVGTEGKLGGQADVPGVAGTWKDLTDSVNSMAGNLTGQVRNIAAVTTAVANGDLAKKITADVRGEFLELKDTINTMVDQLSSFASEVTRVAREVGTEGKLGGQAEVKGVAGTWKDLTDNVNFMAGNLTSQVRGIAKVVSAVANGDLKQKLTVEAKGEIASLADTINSMIDTLATFAQQVTTVAREVSVEGKLGGQASVPGAAGTWKDLTDNVNQLAANLTTQVRAIAEVAIAVTKGDLTRSIKVAAQGEVAVLKDNINKMIRNLKDTTLKNAEQDWLKTNLAKFSRMLQGERDLLTVGRLILSELAPVVSAQQGLLYTLETGDERPVLRFLAGYAAQDVASELELGEGLIGQCALENRKILMSGVPTGYGVKIASGLGAAPPLSIIVLPVVFERQVKAVLELASFESFNPAHQAFLDQLTESIGIVLNTIEANTRTENLLAQSQSLARELQSQQQELQQTNQLLVEQNQEVERKNQEVEQARQALEEKAKQLALTSKYKSEFLANMSHELRTPLNSLLILSDQLSRNPEGNLTEKQTEFAKTIHSAGNDLLTLINDILDLSKIESGTVVVDVGDVRFADLLDYVGRTFRHVAEARGVEFDIRVDPVLPRSIATDSKRLQQVLKNLLSNAFKFTERGRVELAIRPAESGWSPQIESLQNARSVIAISVQDTGIGIPADKQQLIFEAFQQVDGSTSRKYGGTGLGLAISREIARLLGGEIRLESTSGQGSKFTLYLPELYVAPSAVRAETSTSPSSMILSDLEASRGTPEVAIPAEEIADDRAAIQAGDRVILLVDNDENFVRYLLDLANERGFKGLVATRGADAIALARERRPDAITLDIQLPDIDGWRVLDRLKSDPNTRHIPVYVISTADDIGRSFQMGAFAVLNKPIQTKAALEEAFERIRAFIERPVRRALVVSADAAARESTAERLFSPALAATAIAPGREALEAIASGDFDGVVLHVADGQEELDLYEGLVREAAGRDLPVLLYAPGEIAETDEPRLRRLSQEGSVRNVRSVERLLDQASLAFHLPLLALPDEARRAVTEHYESHAALAGKTVLIVDDDVRNIFALTSVLERQNMAVLSAETGRDAISLLDKSPSVDVVLMDIMMPGMDGYDTIREIRKDARFKNLPIIAVTAKAMKGDREKTIEAGAWDYLAKPVDAEQMISVLKAWLYR